MAKSALAITDRPPTPRGEHAWVGFYNRSGALFGIVTSKNDSREWFYYYEVCDGKFVKIGKSKNPLDFYDKYNINDRLKEQG